MQGVNASILCRCSYEETMREREGERVATFSDTNMYANGTFSLLPRRPLFTFHSDDRRP